MFDIDKVETGNQLDKSIVIDNGEAKAKVDIQGFQSDYSNVLSANVINRMCMAVSAFQRDVGTEKAKGIHLGSTDLNSAVGSIFYEPDGKVNPGKYGLQTETELKLAAKAISTYVKPLK